MYYFYLHPFKPQYFFPKGFEKHEIFLSFYHPYSLIGRVSWWLFRRIPIYRHLLKIKNIEPHIPEKEIRKLIGLTSEIAFNTGTKGSEQKVTALGFENNEYFFLKYAQTKEAAKNVANEYNILKQLTNINNIPRVLDFQINDNHVLLKTTVLVGNRYNKTQIDDKLLNLLTFLSSLQIKTSNAPKSNLKTCFAHGDFCPWNMMLNNGKILLFDWEMASTRPLGYDLFTFIFQSNFLLHPEKDLNSIYDENFRYINQYFNHFNIIDWQLYLIEFSEIKIKIEQEKVNDGLFKKYQTLLNYVKKV